MPGNAQRARMAVVRAIPQPAKELSRELSRPNIAKRESQDSDTRHQSRWLQIPDDFAPAQVRKNANRMTPRISTASPVEAESNASTEGPGSACRASVEVSTIRWFCLVAHGSLIPNLRLARHRRSKSNAWSGMMFRAFRAGKLKQNRPKRHDLEANHRAPPRLTPLGDSSGRCVLFRVPGWYPVLSSVAFRSIPWPPAPTGKASCVFRS